MREISRTDQDFCWQRVGLSKRGLSLFKQRFQVRLPTIKQCQVSRYDQSVKLVVGFADGGLVEAVIMPENGRVTLCLSSQVGCAQGCRFCHTGRMGLGRDLSAGEIVGQVLLAQKWIDDHPLWAADGNLPRRRVSNLVFMGMGEPLDNVRQVKSAIEILTDQNGFALALKKVSVSTAGHLPGLKQLLQFFPNLSVALSLHSAIGRQRSQLMPINKHWPLSLVLDFLRHHYQMVAPRGSFLVQYTLMAGLNDGVRQANELVGCLQGIPAKVNLIPYNEFGSSSFRGPAPDVVETFKDIIYRAGIRVMVRYSKGQDIAAACGQLVQPVVASK